MYIFVCVWESGYGKKIKFIKKKKKKKQTKRGEREKEKQKNN